MKQIIIFLGLTLVFSQKQITSGDIDKITELRNELPQEITYFQDGHESAIGRCGFIDYGNSDRAEKSDYIRKWKSDNPRHEDISIPIAFHVIHTNNNTGYVPESAVNEQVTVLNDAFNQYGISFTLSSLDYTGNNNWFNNDSENAYKSALAISPSTTLNIYTTTAGGYLGYAYLPSQFDENSYMHGVVLHHNSLPNVYNWVYDEGDTGTHEVGHYLGLYHTFQGGCGGNGDYVDDTPAQDDGNNIFDCYDMDTCPSDPGNDPIHNFMNYTDDDCITDFTNGQSDRMDYMVATYKPSLGTESCEDQGLVTCSDGTCEISEDDCSISSCGSGYVPDCSGDGDCCLQSWIGDNYSDCEDQQYGCDLTCYDCDGGDCPDTDPGCSDPGDTYGCTDPEACNYDSDATMDDGSCAENDECGVCDGDGNDCNNMQLDGHLNFEQETSDITGFYQDDREFAVVGLQNAAAFVDITDPSSPFEVGRISGNNSIWRDLKYWNRHVYIGTEASDGVKVVSVDNLDNPSLVSTISDFGNSHNIHIDADGYLYVVGASSNDVWIYELTDHPAMPQLVGTWNGEYLHDIEVYNNKLYGAGIYTGKFYIIDVSDKTNPTTLTSYNTGGGYISTHDCAITDDEHYLITADETTGGRIKIWDIQNYSNINLVSDYWVNLNHSVHNVYIRPGTNLAIISSYADGTRILDISDPTNPIEVAFYDTSNIEGLYVGNWGTYAYLPSGNIISSDIETGLYIFSTPLIPQCDVGFDCAGVCGGSSLEDNCNVCDSDLSNDCTQDCSGEWGGSAALDECGVCDGDNSTCSDCAGTPNGSAVVDNCGTCDTDSSNDCVQDCAGVWGGSLED